MKQIHKWSSDLKLSWWGNGEWVEEPDEIYWEYRGIECKIIRCAAIDGIGEDKISEEDLKTVPIFGGHLCGYISIPLDHPWSEKGIDIDCDVHGGCTWNELEKDGKRWIGFDCAHSFDITPSMIKTNEKIKKDCIRKYPGLVKEHSPVFNNSYKNIAFCIKECERLADQMIEAI